MKIPENRFPLVLAALGCTFLICGITLLVIKSTICDYLLRSTLRLTPDSFLFELWQKPPIELATTFYFFNWTNKEDFYNLSSKPKFEEVGPYKFHHNIEKVNITWNDNGTITYKQIRRFRYDDEVQSSTRCEEITTLNFIYMAVAHYARDFNSFLKILGSSFFDSLDVDYFITKTADELTIQGFEDPLATLAYHFPFIAPEIPRFEKFGFIKMRDRKEDFDGIFNIATGENRNFELKNWNFHNRIPFLDNSCNEIKGSAGELHTYNKNQDYIDVFVSELCRPLRLEFEEEVEVDGILGRKYSMRDKVFDNGTKIPENKCFCDGDCIPSGLLNVTSCQILSIYASLPHFYNADPIYLNDVEGLKPEKDKHEAYVILEPTTFLPIKVKIRVQGNFHVHPIENLRVFENAPSLYFPIFWVEIKSDLPEFFGNYLRTFLRLPLIMTAGAMIQIFLGILILPYAVYRYDFLRSYSTKYPQRGSSKAEIVPLNVKRILKPVHF